jgi:SAM-dependent methyltransferase
VRDLMLRALGWRLLLLHSDTLVLDRWLWLRRRLKRGPLRTFDAGCGNGAFSMYAARRGNRVVAASFSQGEQLTTRTRAEALGIDGIDLRLIDLRELESRRGELGTFDQIICLETVEHLLDDEALVGSLAAMLAPGGQLLLTTPYDRHRPLYGESVNPSEVEDGSHVRFGYSQERLAELAAGAGLRVIEQSFVSGAISQALTNLLWRLTARLGLLAAWLLILPLRPLVALDAALTRALRYPHLCVALQAEKLPAS